MPLDPNISLSFQPPQMQSPLATAAQIQALQTGRLQQQSTQLELQQQQLKAQQQQQAMQAFAQSGGDVDKALNAMQLQGNPLYFTYRTQQAALQKSLDDQRKAADEHLGQVKTTLGNLASSVLNTPAESRSIAYNSARQYATQIYPELSGKLPDYTPAMDAQLSTWAGAAQTPKDIAQTAQAKASTEKTTTDTAVAQVKLKRDQQMLADYQANPQQWGDALIDSVLPPAQDANANASFKNEIRQQMHIGGPEAAMKVIEAATNYSSDVNKAANPIIQQARVNEAAAVATRLAPITIGTTIQTEREKAKLLPGALSPVVDSQLRNKAETGFTNAQKAYDASLGTFRKFKNVIQGALQGNKAAPTLAGVAELRQYTNRVTNTELGAVAGAGNAKDRINGWLDHWTQGQPIPQNILKDMYTLARAQHQVDRQTYESALKSTNTLTGSKFVPDAVPDDITAGLATGGSTQPAHKVRDTVMYQGRPHRISAISPDGKLTLAP